ncbi:MAG: glutamate--tRNA ligase [Rickettsia sp.]|nr:glutamate--tRNA ligase [Rickettsia sp.]
MIITRFAPSPTGALHIGSARTALFNYLFAKHNNGKFILRIEDTDIIRSKKEFEEEILLYLNKLGIDYDELYFQSKNFKRHFDIANELVILGKAYYCLSSKEEIQLQKSSYQSSENKTFIFQSPWRDKNQKEVRSKNSVIRFKTPREGVTYINDLVQGNISVENKYIEDFVISRSDNTSTYILASAVDDHDSCISHVIRGDDHINNAIRQKLIYQALGWKIPYFVHISLLHDEKGQKLSKRSGLEQYEVKKILDDGYLPDALRNYILRLGWSYGDHEIISKEDSIKWFNLKNLGKSPARIDFKKLDYLNRFYLVNIPDQEIMSYLEKCYHEDGLILGFNSKEVIFRSISELKKRANNIHEIYIFSKVFLVEQNLEISKDDQNFVKNSVDKRFLEFLIKIFENSREEIDDIALKEIFNDISLKFNCKVQLVFKIFRIILTSNKSSLSLYVVIRILGVTNVVFRLKNFYAKY